MGPCPLCGEAHEEGVFSCREIGDPLVDTDGRDTLVELESSAQPQSLGRKFGVGERTVARRKRGRAAYKTTIQFGLEDMRGFRDLTRDVLSLFWARGALLCTVGLVYLFVIYSLGDAFEGEGAAVWMSAFVAASALGRVALLIKAWGVVVAHLFLALLLLINLFLGLANIPFSARNTLRVLSHSSPGLIWWVLAVGLSLVLGTFAGVLPGLLVLAGGGHVIAVILMEETRGLEPVVRGLRLWSQVWRTCIGGASLIAVGGVCGAWILRAALHDWPLVLSVSWAVWGAFALSLLATLWFVSYCEARRTVDHFDGLSLARRCATLCRPPMHPRAPGSSTPPDEEQRPS